jgi:hypothetical protein
VVIIFFDFYTESYHLSQPVSRKCYGRLLFFTVYVEGTLEEVNEAFLDEIHQMKSFKYMELFVKVGGPIRKTIDCFTFGGIVKLINTDLSELVANYTRIKEIESLDLFKTI